MTHLTACKEIRAYICLDDVLNLGLVPFAMSLDHPRVHRYLHQYTAVMLYHLAIFVSLDNFYFEKSHGVSDLLITNPLVVLWKMSHNHLLNE